MTIVSPTAKIGQGLVWIVVLLALCACSQESTVSDKHSKNSETAEQRRLSPAAAEQSVRKALAGDKTTFGALTPPLPSQWPPGPQPKVVYFVYRTSALPTGMNLSEVYSPSTRVELFLATGGELSPTIQRLEFHKLKGSEDGTVHSSTQAEMEQAEAELFRLTALPSGKAAESIRRAYGGWIQDHPVITNAIRPSFVEFFKWLEER